MDEQLIHERLDVFEQRLAELLALVEELVFEARAARMHAESERLGLRIREVA